MKGRGRGNGEEKLLNVSVGTVDKVGCPVDLLVHRGKIGRAQQVSQEGEQPSQDPTGGSSQFAHQPLQVGLGCPIAERVGGGFLQVVGFINDQVVVFRQHPVAGDCI